MTAEAALLVPGGKGQVGFELNRLARHRLVHAPGSGELDVTDPDLVADAVDSFAESARDSELRPVVINLAAYTSVDAAEHEQEKAAAVNSRGAGALARACHARGVPMLHVSTDYVFSGEATRAYEPDAATGPRTVYGRTKLDGECAVLESDAQAWVVRTAWVYGANGGNFVKTIARLAETRSTLSIVEDEIGSPTWAADLAAGLLELADCLAVRQGPPHRVLHCTNSGQASRFEFASAIFTAFGLDPGRLQPCPSTEFPLPAPRPAFSVLSDGSWRAAGLVPLRSWQDALTAAVNADGDVLRGG